MEHVLLVHDDETSEGVDIPLLPDGSRYVFVIRDVEGLGDVDREVWKRYPNPQGSEFRLAGRGGKNAHPAINAEVYLLPFEASKDSR